MAAKSSTLQIHEVYKNIDHGHEKIHGGSMSEIDHSHEQIHSGSMSQYASGV